MTTTQDRFEAFVERIPEAGCWIWTGTVTRHGYGQIAVNRRPVSAHRYAYSIAFGSIPNGLCVCHRCDVRACVNPAHLFLGTNMENMRDKMAKGRHVSSVGERNGNAKLTNEQVLAIRSDSRSLREIAADYGVVDTTISHIKTGRNWSKVRALTGDALMARCWRDE